MQLKINTKSFFDFDKFPSYSDTLIYKEEQRKVEKNDNKVNIHSSIKKKNSLDPIKPNN
jgi:type II secretory pathway component PulL